MPSYNIGWNWKISWELDLLMEGEENQGKQDNRDFKIQRRNSNENVD